MALAAKSGAVAGDEVTAGGGSVRDARAVDTDAPDDRCPWDVLACGGEAACDGSGRRVV
jgi:hypothetical protein